MTTPHKRILVIASHARSLVNFRGPLIKALTETGCEVHATAPSLSRDLATLDTLRSWGITTHDIPMERTGLNPISDVGTTWAVYQLLRKIEPDSIFGYTIKPVIYGMVAARFAGVPSRYPLITGLGYAFTGEATGKRWIIQYLARRLYRSALSKSTKVLFQNPDDEALFRELKLLPDTVPSEVVNGSGIDTQQFEPTPIPDGCISFLLIARLLGDKGVREYVEAARELKKENPSAAFRLVGDLDTNPDSISQSELDEWTNSDVIEYLGQLDDVRSAIAQSSVYVLPSYREGTPRTVLEAMAMGRPIITTDAPGCRETVIEGDNGFLVPVKDSLALADAMRRFIDQPDLIARMGKCSRELAVDKYDVHGVNKAIMEVMGISRQTQND